MGAEDSHNVGVEEAQEVVKPVGETKKVNNVRLAEKLKQLESKGFFARKPKNNVAYAAPMVASLKPVV